MRPSTRTAPATRTRSVVAGLVTWAGAVSMATIAGCLSTGTHVTGDVAPRPCTYQLSRTRNVRSMSSVGAPYRAVVTATVRDSAGHPLQYATIARMPGGPGANANDSGKAILRLSERDVARRDSTNIMVRRIGYVPMGIPARVAAGDSIDIVASMCAYHGWLSSKTVPAAPAHDHAAIGAGIGLVTGSIVGYVSQHGSCDPGASKCTGARSAVGGAVVGALLGYGIGHLFTSRSACMPADAYSAGMIAGVRAMVDTNDASYRDLRARWGIRAVAPTQVYLVTDERVCRRARQALDSLIHKYDPDAPGMKRFPSVYVVRAGSIVDVETPGGDSNIFDAITWKFLGALVVPS